MNEAAVREEVLSFMRELELEPEHVLHVTGLALQLFDALIVLHELNSWDRIILEAAALLHDIGWSAAPDGKRHHKETARLIREHSWTCFEAEEVSIISLVARYHRRSMPTERHKRFMKLSRDDRRRVRLLAGILRVADALDRRHQQYVRGVNAVLLEGRILFQLKASTTPDQEIEAAERKGDLMRAVVQRELGFVVIP